MTREGFIKLGFEIFLAALLMIAERRVYRRVSVQRLLDKRVSGKCFLGLMARENIGGLNGESICRSLIPVDEVHLK